jgi:hypothetical protein
MDTHFTGAILAHGHYDAANKTYTFIGATNPLKLGGKESLAIRLEYTRMK